MPDRHEPQIARANQEERGHVPKGIHVPDPRDLVRYREDASREGLASAADHQCGAFQEEIDQPRADRGREFAAQVGGERNELGGCRRTGRRHESFDPGPREHARFSTGRAMNEW